MLAINCLCFIVFTTLFAALLRYYLADNKKYDKPFTSIFMLLVMMIILNVLLKIMLVIALMLPVWYMFFSVLLCCCVVASFFSGIYAAIDGVDENEEVVTYIDEDDIAFMDDEDEPEEVVSSRYAVKDHKGKEYPSQAAMCKAYGISPSTFRSRISKGVSVEEALKK